MHIFSRLSKGTSLLYFLPSMIFNSCHFSLCENLRCNILKTLSPKIFKIFLIPVYGFCLGYSIEHGIL